MEPVEVVHQFLGRLSGGDLRGALDLVDDGIVYTNVGFPTARGRRQAAFVLKQLDRPFMGFAVQTVNSAADGPVVLTERVDELRVGRLRAQFWVCGRFEVRAGRITVWRDYFDVFDMTKAFARGLVALVIPSIQKPLNQVDATR
ncbi:limonene-1,2-epoxide hydrolase family protein [Rhodococcus sp. NPDC127528]|uniref:limonene-1,2-epoxide hydrolase family protein n=1 Tax=unclassified Rhodococcus (in: high G+C Gram-positive bacteria) TaxID=192944 RepID=UPI0036452779